MFRRTLIDVAFVVIAAQAALVSCGKSSDSLNGLAQQTPVEPNTMTDEFLADPQQMENKDIAQLGQLVVVVGDNGRRYVELAIGSQVEINNRVYVSVPEQSYYDGSRIHTVYVSGDNVQLIISGNVTVRANAPVAQCSVYTVAPTGQQNDMGVLKYTRPKLSPMRQAAYRECRELYPTSLDRLSRQNRLNRNACQKQVAHRTFSDERDWRDSIFNTLGGA